MNDVPTVHRRIALATALFAALGSGCGAGEDAATAREAISARTALLSRSYESGNADSLASVFASDGMQIPPNGPSVSGRAEIAAYWREALSWGRWTFRYAAASVDVAGAHAIETGRYTHEFEPNLLALPGMGPMRETGHYVFHWRRGGEGWELAVDISNRDEPLSRGAPLTADSVGSTPGSREP